MFSILSYREDIAYNDVETPTFLENTENYFINENNNTMMITVFTK